MAGKKKAKKRRPLGQRLALGFFLFMAVALASLCAWMYIQAHILHLCRAQLYLPDLPEAFDGTKLLFLSDFNLRTEVDERACARLLDRLSPLEPDLLILGGDYVSDDKKGFSEIFKNSLASFPASMGKFAVAGEIDKDTELLENAMTSAGVQLLNDACVAVERSEDKLILSGLSDITQTRTPYEEMGSYFSGDECVLVFAHNPSAYVGVRVAEARNGGPWADAVFSGHTLGGQIRLFGRTLRNMPEAEARCLGGWYYSDDLPLLVSQGVGCRDVNLRLGSRSEAWLITLCCPQQAEVELP